MDDVRDRIGIEELKARYCRLLDTKQWDAWADLFTEDYELDISAETGLPPIRGRDAALEQVLGHIREAKTVHQVHSPEIRVEGNAAHAIWAIQDRVIFGPHGPSITGYGHYEERLVRRDDAWKIAALKLTRLHIDLHSGSAGNAQGAGPARGA